MSTDTVVEAAPAPARSSPERAASTAIARVTARKALRSGALWGLVFGLYVTTQATVFASTYPTVASRELLVRDYGANTGIAALVGPARDLGTVAGFTAWKCLAVLTIFAAVWGLLTGTRLLRGEEESGRWELLLAGPTTRARAAALALAGLAVGVVALWVVSSVIAAAAGRDSAVDISGRSMAFLMLVPAAAAGMFTAVGAVTSQLATTRRQAAGYAAAVLGVSYALRAVADSGVGLGWLRDLSPLGWLQQLQPLTSPRPLFLIPVVLSTLALGALATGLAAVRDLGVGTLPDRPRRAARNRLLFGSVGLTLRLMLPTVAGWLLAIVGATLLLGLVAKSAGNALLESASFKTALARLGATGVGATAYLGVAFLIVATLVTLIAVGQVGATRAEEASGRVEHLLVRPVARTSWLAGRLCVATATLVLAGVVAALGTLAGTSLEHANVGVGSVVGAGLNLVPPAICVLGIGALAIGVWPRGAVGVAYGVLAWSFLVELVGSVEHVSHWVLDSSVFHQMTAAPAVAPDWTTNAMLVVLGAAAAGVGLVVFARRDLSAE